MPEVLIESLVKAYGTMRATNEVDLHIKGGEFVTLLGPSGCGKTTLLRCIAGLEVPDSGRISLGERVVAEPRAGTFVPPDRRHLGMVFQSYALWPHLSVRGNVAYPLRRQKRSRRDIDARVTELIYAVGLDGLHARRISELSGGQQQRVALARALAAGSDLVLYDEPLSNLDAGMRVAMRDQIRAIHDQMGTTSIFVTHDQEEALALSDRVVIMSKGEIVQTGTPQEVYAAPRNSFVASFLGFENIYAVQVTTDPTGPTVVLPSGEPIEISAGEPRAATATGIAIKASHVRVGTAARPDEGAVMTGRVQTRTYVGDRTELKIDVNGMPVHAVVLNHLVGSDIPAEGDLTQVQFPAHLLAPLSDAEYI